MTTRNLAWIVSLALILAAVSPMLNAESVESPILIEKSSKSKEVSINVPGEEFRLWQLQGRGNYPMQSYVIETGRTQKIIVIDGGAPIDGSDLRLFLQQRFKNGNSSVHAWFLTHQHSNHIGALNAILQSGYPQDLIRMIYGSFLPVSSFKDIPNEVEHVAIAQALNDAIDRLQIPHNLDIPLGTVIWIDGVKFEILSVKNPELAFPSEGNFLNDSSLVLRVSDGSRSVLFTGDLGRLAARKLLAGPYASRLRSDYVQMAHHGSNGASCKFYEQVNARYCLWPTTDAIYEGTVPGDCNDNPPYPPPATPPTPERPFTAFKTRATVESPLLCGPADSGRHFPPIKIVAGAQLPYFREISP